jgi:hypothetical protein
VKSFSDYLGSFLKEIKQELKHQGDQISYIMGVAKIKPNILQKSTKIQIMKISSSAELAELENQLILLSNGLAEDDDDVMLAKWFVS